MAATTEEMFTELPTVSNATMSDIICAVQGYVSPSNLGLSVQESLQQVYNLFQSNIILFNSGNPNGSLAGTTYQFCWDTLNDLLWICTTSGTSSTAVWTRANVNSGYTTTATANGTTTLTIESNYWQFFTGTLNQTVVMPVTSTLAQGITWSIVNESTGTVTIQSSGLNTITTLASGQRALITCILNSGTSASSWYAALSASGGGVASITGTANQVIASSSTGAVTLSTPQDIATTSSPTFNALTLTNPLTQANGGTENSTPLTNGELWVGNTGNPPSRTTLTAGSNISISNGAGSITISATGLAGFSWTTVTGTSQAMLSNNGYIANNAGLVTLTLPATSAVGDEIDIIGKGAGGWKVQCGVGQTIVVGSSTTTSGGSVASTNAKDSFYMICTTANTEWTVASAPQSSGLTIA
ncbi:hypothetical protein [Legionella micdadei]|uniref:Uncharacterized protein n=2 Tax=Legionella micdadei TaxID=451 RepID=A0A098GG60_LEGMI|nr:hypothetical protein [Legionella micdadei]KTD27539.1 hypothetical protein Lmic_1859 [Legionella micdadei]CEG60972.1 protein of unknown function [Legionella micdadei]SCY69791.1 hypothetical protein SAMN02982997_02543 [Legionella micdadei]